MLKQPFEVAHTVCEAGVRKARRQVKKMFLLSVLAGVYVGFGAQVATTASMDAAQYIGVGLSKVVTGTVFSVGLILVLVAGAELFTGNNLIFMSYWSRKITANELLKNWAVVYAGNFVGSVLLAWIIYNTGLYTMAGNALGLKALSIASGKVNIPFTQAFFRGLVCNWLVCLAVWIASSAEDTTGKILACIFPIMAFVASGFEHSVANMYFVPMGIFLKDASFAAQSSLNLSGLSWAGFIGRNLIPVTLGNILGGAVFVAAVYCYIYMKE
ncbi:formate/nitrite transporter family protein [Candidatus Bathyarchaeota archaeon]|nr:formate/nitrite transporter family protein [Candidatus Bathyarchaeota archaeon]